MFRIALVRTTDDHLAIVYHRERLPDSPVSVMDGLGTGTIYDVAHKVASLTSVRARIHVDPDRALEAKGRRYTRSQDGPAA